MLRIALAFIFICLCAYVFTITQRIWQLYQIRRKTQFSSKIKATLFDVKELIKQGRKESAIVLYCEIFSVSRKDSLKAVEELERSIQSK